MADCKMAYLDDIIVDACICNGSFVWSCFL